MAWEFRGNFREVVNFGPPRCRLRLRFPSTSAPTVSVGVKESRALKKGSVYKASESGVFKQLREKFDFSSDFRFSWGCFEVKSGLQIFDSHGVVLK